jgi:hypothetical protein
MLCGVFHGTVGGESLGVLEAWRAAKAQRRRAGCGWGRARSSSAEVSRGGGIGVLGGYMARVGSCGGEVKGVVV